MVNPTGVVVLTDRRLAAGPLPAVVEAAVSGGARWVILRERDLRYAERHALAATLRASLPPGHLIVAGPDPLDGDAVHLSATDPMPAGPDLVGRSCHSAAELGRLDGEHYVTLSPVFDTETKPGYGPALTPDAAARWGSPVPWLALGGVDSAERAGECAAAGAAGIAVMGAVMRASDPARTVRDLLTGFAAAQAAGEAVAPARAAGETARRGLAAGEGAVGGLAMREMAGGSGGGGDGPWSGGRPGPAGTAGGGGEGRA